VQWLDIGDCLLFLQFVVSGFRKVCNGRKASDEAFPLVAFGPGKSSVFQKIESPLEQTFLEWKTILTRPRLATGATSNRPCSKGYEFFGEQFER
jgi:hypothetical protein